MTVTFKGEMPGHRKATNTKGMRTYSRGFLLQSDSKTIREYEVGSHASLPRIGSLHPADSNAWCTTLTVDNYEPWAGWLVTAEYSSEWPLEEDPTQDPARIQWDGEQFQVQAMTDRDGNAICNSAGDPYDPPLLKDDNRWSVSITKNLSVVPSWILTYQNAVNSASFVLDGITIGAELAKIQRVSVGPLERRNDITFRTVSLLMHLSKDGWGLKKTDEGFREIGGASGSGSGTGAGLINILNEGDSRQPTAVVPLDGNGSQQLSPGPTTNVTRTHYVYDALPFNILPLT